MRFDFEMIKGILLCMGFPLVPFVGTILIGMLYQNILSLVLGDGFDLKESFEQNARFAIRPTLYLYFFIWFCVLLAFLGIDVSSIY